MATRDLVRGWRLLGLAGVLLFVVAALLYLNGFVFLPFQEHRDATHVPLAASPYLRDVVEPITMVRGSSTAGSDDHWLGFTFKDGKGVERQAKYVYYWPPVGNTPEVVKTVLLDKKVPKASREENALLGLIQRWYATDAEAHELALRVERRDPTLGRTPFGWDGLNDPQEGKIVAVLMMHILQDRD